MKKNKLIVRYLQVPSSQNKFIVLTGTHVHVLPCSKHKTKGPQNACVTPALTIIFKVELLLNY